MTTPAEGREVTVLIYGPPSSGKTTILRHLEFSDGAALSDVDRRREYRRLIQATAISSLTELVEFALSLGWSLDPANVQRYEEVRESASQLWRERSSFPLKMAYDMKCLWDDEVVQAAYREPCNPNRNKLVTRYYLEKLFLLFENQYVPNRLDILSTHDQGRDPGVGEVVVRVEDVRVRVVEAPWEFLRERRVPEGLRRPYVVVLVAPVDEYDRDPTRAVVPRPLGQPRRRAYGNPLYVLSEARRLSRGAGGQQAPWSPANPSPVDKTRSDEGPSAGIPRLSQSNETKTPVALGHSQPSQSERHAEDFGAISDGGLSSKPASKKAKGKSSRGHKRRDALKSEERLPHGAAPGNGASDPPRLALRSRRGSDLPDQSPREIPSPMIAPAQSPRQASNGAATTETASAAAEPASSPNVAATEVAKGAEAADGNPYDNHLTGMLRELEEIADHKMLQEAASAVVYLNKLDVYWQKARVTPVHCSFPEYAGGADPRRALEHILAQFESKLKAKQRPFRYQVVSACSLDDEQMTSVVLPLLLDETKRCASAIKREEVPKVAATVPAQAARPPPPGPEEKGQGKKKKKSSTPPAESKKLRVKSGSVTDIGRRCTNEDTHEAIEDVTEGYSGSAKMHFFAVYDGHGGCATAAAAAQLLMKCILEDVDFTSGDVEKATRNAYLQADTAMAQTSASDKSGATAVTAMIIGKTLYVANVGDSECVIGFREGKSVRHALLTYKHVPTAPDERQRVTSIGGMIVSNRLFGTLAVSRAFGDREFKDASRMFVVAEPHLLTRALTRADQVLVVACDGLWDKVTYQEAVEFAAAQREASKSPEEAARLLVQMSIERGSMDNVTVIVVYLFWG